jgi:hypothetical protein
MRDGGEGADEQHVVVVAKSDKPGALKPGNE